MPEQKRSIKGPLIIIGIVLIVVVALFAVPFGFIYFKSKAQCGEGGMLIGSANKGYYCGYQSICENCQNASQCPDCSQLCESKGKIKREGYCGPNQIDLTNKIKRDSEGNIYIEEGPINCYCCCNEKGDNQEEIPDITKSEPKNTEQIVEKDKASENTEIESAHISEKKEHPYLIIDETMLPEAIRVVEVYDPHILKLPPKLQKWIDYYKIIYFHKVTYYDTEHGFHLSAYVDVPTDDKQFSKEYFEDQNYMDNLEHFIDGKYAFIEKFEVDSVWRWMSIDENTGESFIVGINSRNGFPETNNALINLYLKKYPPIDASE